MRRADRGDTAGCPDSGYLAGANRLSAVDSVLLAMFVATPASWTWRCATSRPRPLNRPPHLAFLRVGIACLGASFALLALPQVFYCLSLDVPVGGDARARGLDRGKTMARRLFRQNLGMMSGSLRAGALFDEALRRAMPSLAWSLPATCSLAMLVAWTAGMPRARA